MRPQLNGATLARRHETHPHMSRISHIILFASWAVYGLLWLAAIKSTSWFRGDDDLGTGIIVVMAFGIGLCAVATVIFAGLAVAVFAMVRNEPGAWRWWNVGLVFVSAAGLLWQVGQILAFFGV